MTETIAAVLGAIAGGILGIISTYFATREARSTALEVIKINEFNSASIAFFNAFLPTIMALDERYQTGDRPDDINVMEVIEKDIKNQTIAMLRFRLYLPSSKVETFNSAWRAYCRYDISDGSPKNQFLAQYNEEIWNGQPTRKLALTRISNLLSFTGELHSVLLNLKMTD
jgi:hypothetical protein